MSRRRLEMAVVSAALAVLAAGAVFAQPPADVERLTRSAQLIFRGTVQKVGAANLAAVKPGDDTAVVRIDEVLSAGGSLDDFTGREVTVKLAAPRSARPGEQAIFFTNGWIYGETLGLLEVGRTPVHAQMRALVADTGRKIREEKIKDRVGRAALVVAGKVVATHPAAKRGVPGVTEHDPVWWEAVIEVESAIKGKAARRVTFLFPTSLDVQWAESPKPAPGWNAVWLLYRDQIPELHVDGYTALKPWNVMSRADEAIVRRLAQ